VPPTQTDWELIQSDPQLSPQLSDYSAAVATSPELVDLINGENVVTVFVPTDDAVRQVPNWDAIVADPIALETFVRSHIVPGAVTAEQLFTGTEPYELTMLGGQKVIVDPIAKTINGASIVTSDTPATNGIVHTIDQLFSVPPPSTTTPSTTAPSTTAPSTTAPPTVGPTSTAPAG
jgi:uncharacterized surface protein with fasciclin (FAS1) repeats